MNILSFVLCSTRPNHEKFLMHPMVKLSHFLQARFAYYSTSTTITGMRGAAGGRHPAPAKPPLSYITRAGSKKRHAIPPSGNEKRNTCFSLFISTLEDTTRTASTRGKYW